MADIGVFLCYHLRVPLSPTAVIHKVGLEVSFTPKPDATCLTEEDVFYNDRNGNKHIHTELSKACENTTLNIVGSRNLRPKDKCFNFNLIQNNDFEIVQNLKYIFFCSCPDLNVFFVCFFFIKK